MCACFVLHEAVSPPWNLGIEWRLLDGRVPKL